MTSVRSGELEISKVRLDGGTQSRVALNDEAVAEYAAVIRDGQDFPPIVVFFDGSDHWLADGFHRYHAYRQSGAVKIAADVREGTKRDAILHSVGANAAHGLNRSVADKRRSVTMLLDDEEWSKWSNRQLAKAAGVGETMVRSLRAERSEELPAERIYRTKHGTPATMNTAAIGKFKEDRAAVKAAKEAERAEGEARIARAEAELPDEVKALQQARATAKAARAAESSTEAQLSEQADEIAALKADVEALRAETKLFGAMKVEWEKGGFAEVIAVRDERIRVLKGQVERESRDKVTWKKKADYWKAEALKLGWSVDVVIPLDEGANV